MKLFIVFLCLLLFGSNARAGCSTLEDMLFSAEKMFKEFPLISGTLDTGQGFIVTAHPGPVRTFRVIIQTSKDVWCSSLSGTGLGRNHYIGTLRRYRGSY